MSLFDYHQRINREKKARRRSDKLAISTFKEGLKIKAADRLEALRRDDEKRARNALHNESDKAWKALYEQSTKTTAAINKCAAIMPGLCNDWLQRVEKGLLNDLKELDSELQGLVQTLSSIFTALIQAAKRRGATIMVEKPWLLDEPALPVDRDVSMFNLPLLIKLPGAKVLAVDLRGIRDQILKAVPQDLHRMLLCELDAIDQPSDAVGSLTPADKARVFASNIGSICWHVDYVRMQVSDLAAKYRTWSDALDS